jgi:hypothetical protein
MVVVMVEETLAMVVPADQVVVEILETQEDQVMILLFLHPKVDLKEMMVALVALTLNQEVVEVAVVVLVVMDLLVLQMLVVLVELD